MKPTYVLDPKKIISPSDRPGFLYYDSQDKYRGYYPEPEAEEPQIRAKPYRAFEAYYKLSWDGNFLGSTRIYHPIAHAGKHLPIENYFNKETVIRFFPNITTPKSRSRGYCRLEALRLSDPKHLQMLIRFEPLKPTPAYFFGNPYLKTIVIPKNNDIHFFIHGNGYPKNDHQCSETYYYSVPKQDATLTKSNVLLRCRQLDPEVLEEMNFLMSEAKPLDLPDAPERMFFDNLNEERKFKLFEK